MSCGRPAPSAGLNSLRDTNRVLDADDSSHFSYDTPCRVQDHLTALDDFDASERARPINEDCMHFAADEQERVLEKIFDRYTPQFLNLVQSRVGTKNVLELSQGYGSGGWSIRCASDFPHVACTGISLAPVHVRVVPENCRFEIDDINLGLEHLYDRFDFIRVRFLSSRTHNYAALVEALGHALRDGGWVDFFEWDFRLYDEHRRPLQHNLLNKEMYLDAAMGLQDWIQENDTLDLDSVVQRACWVPLSPAITRVGKREHHDSSILPFKDAVALVNSFRILSAIEPCQTLADPHGRCDHLCNVLRDTAGPLWIKLTHTSVRKYSLF